MWILLFIAIAIIVYVRTFRKDFSDEHISVLLPVLVLAVILNLLWTAIVG